MPRWRDSACMTTCFPGAPHWRDWRPRTDRSADARVAAAGAASARRGNIRQSARAPDRLTFVMTLLLDALDRSLTEPRCAQRWHRLMAIWAETPDAAARRSVLD